MRRTLQGMTLILTQAEVRSLLPMDTCMDLVAQGLVTLARDQALNPLRSALLMPDDSGLLGWMPGFVSEPAALGVKVVGVFGANHGTVLDSHQGFVALFDVTTGVPTAIVEGSEITAIRTAAASGVATRLLARADASDLAIIGSGVQARTHLEAMIHARPISRVRVFSSTEANRRAFAERESDRHGLQVEAVDSARAAVDGAHIICTVTSSSQPVVMGEWLADGVHINAAGSSIAEARELDTEAVTRARLFVDRRESTVNEGGDYLTPLAEGAISEAHILGEIGELLLGTVEGRRSEREITLFKSLGLAVEDLVSAEFVARRAREQGVGIEVDLTGRKGDLG
ncbi:MAG: ornithine cyclodeaminase/alanine dehydrogenase-like protein (mu-crystallin family) [Chlamydiales bacterium]|jgi:ornithine cyclodeaminase/alanine dehydrogenase-like protein (mu-crystallin family)